MATELMEEEEGLKLTDQVEVQLGTVIVSVCGHIVLAVHGRLPPPLLSFFFFFPPGYDGS